MRSRLSKCCNRLFKSLFLVIFLNIGKDKHLGMIETGVDSKEKGDQRKCLHVEEAVKESS
jgi:hypothetical protein